MKTRILTLALFATIASCAYAQTENPNYLSKAMASLESGDCKSAQMFYNVYKELEGKTVSSLEVIIADCIAKSDTSKTYIVGDRLEVNNEVYKVAYVENGGKHGFAVKEMGSGPLKPEYIQEQKIPTWSEFNLIKANNSTLKLDGQYWTPRIHDNNQYECYGLGSRPNDYWPTGRHCDLLFIYRF